MTDYAVRKKKKAKKKEQYLKHISFFIHIINEYIP